MCGPGVFGAAGPRGGTFRLATSARVAEELTRGGSCGGDLGGWRADPRQLLPGSSLHHDPRAARLVELPELRRYRRRVDRRVAAVVHRALDEADHDNLTDVDILLGEPCAEHADQLV